MQHIIELIQKQKLVDLIRKMKERRDSATWNLDAQGSSIEYMDLINQAIAIVDEMGW